MAWSPLGGGDLPVALVQELKKWADEFEQHHKSLLWLGSCSILLEYYLS